MPANALTALSVAPQEEEGPSQSEEEEELTPSRRAELEAEGDAACGEGKVRRERHTRPLAASQAPPPCLLFGSRSGLRWAVPCALRWRAWAGPQADLLVPVYVTRRRCGAHDTSSVRRRRGGLHPRAGAAAATCSGRCARAETKRRLRRVRPRVSPRDSRAPFVAAAARTSVHPASDTAHSQQPDAPPSLARQLRQRPACESETSPLFALDPMELAQLALRDAERSHALLQGLSAQSGAALEVGRALFLLERYSEAQAALLEGMALAGGTGSTATALAEALAAVRRVLGGGEGDGKRPRLSRPPRGAGDTLPGEPASGASPEPRAGAAPLLPLEDAECTLCLKLLYAPVTTPCGHAFCRDCLARALDHRLACPLCRAVVALQPAQLQPSLTLAALLRHAYPAEYAARAAEQAGLAPAAPAAEGGGGALLPLFVMDVVLPGQHMALNVFEPRYRLMTRRVLAGSRRFGMVGCGEGGALLPWACEVEVTECEPLPDGRFFLQVVGRRRCRLAATQEQDGYRVGRCEFDPPLPPADPAAHPDSDAATLPVLAARADELASAWVERLRACSAGRHREYLARAGTRPPASDPVALSWWIANLLPVPASERYSLLAAEGVPQRLRRELELMSADGGACVVQ